MNPITIVAIIAAILVILLCLAGIALYIYFYISHPAGSGGSQTAVFGKRYCSPGCAYDPTSSCINGCVDITKPGRSCCN